MPMGLAPPPLAAASKCLWRHCRATVDRPLPLASVSLQLIAPQVPAEPTPAPGTRSSLFSGRHGALSLQIAGARPTARPQQEQEPCPRQEGRGP